MAKKDDDSDIHETIGTLKQFKISTEQHIEECKKERKELVTWKTRMQVGMKIAMLVSAFLYWVASHVGSFAFQHLPEKWIKSLFGE